MDLVSSLVIVLCVTDIMLAIITQTDKVLAHMLLTVPTTFIVSDEVVIIVPVIILAETQAVLKMMLTVTTLIHNLLVPAHAQSSSMLLHAGVSLDC